MRGCANRGCRLWVVPLLVANWIGEHAVSLGAADDAAADGNDRPDDFFGVGVISGSQCPDLARITSESECFSISKVLTGSQCEAVRSDKACSTFTSQGTCPASYCTWTGSMCIQATITTTTVGLARVWCGHWLAFMIEGGVNLCVTEGLVGLVSVS